MAWQIDYDRLAKAVGQTIAAASTRIPADIASALEQAFQREHQAASKSALGFILENNKLAAKEQTPICQDTGYPTFFIALPGWADKDRIRALISQELAVATEVALLRPNSVDPSTGKNPGDNSGLFYPSIYFTDVDDGAITVQVLLKGGGSENVSAQYKLPDSGLGAGRDLEGVRKIVLHAVLEAQGFGCAPGVLGVAIGADRAQGYALAKKQLLRPLSDSSSDPELAALESRLLAEANQLDIGSMGFGGATTVLGVKAVKAHRHPASYFVTVAYGCWALRRKKLVFTDTEHTISDQGVTS
jgi:fumarate hydratase, class I